MQCMNSETFHSDLIFQKSGFIIGNFLQCYCCHLALTAANL